MSLASATSAQVDLRLRDLVYAMLIALLFMLPLTYLALPWLLRSRWHLLILGVGLEAASVLPAVALIARWRGARSLPQFGLRACPWRKCLLWGGGGGMALFGIVQLCGMLLVWCGVPPSQQGILAETLLSKPNPGGLAAFFCAAVLVAPIWEEVFFRGLAYTACKRRFGVAAGAALSAVFFALLHSEPLYFRIPIFLLGVCLALLYEFSGCLYVPMLAHAVANAISTLLAYFGLVT